MTEPAAEGSRGPIPDDAVRHAVFSRKEILAAKDLLAPYFLKEERERKRGLMMADVIALAKTPQEEALYRAFFSVADLNNKKPLGKFYRVIYDRIDADRHRIEILF